ncbi:hypothetical protein D1B31_18065 [Neobacillus notoginsengisoli]|uniref:Lipoprotein n=1 Tax=Neobacillus notoginsengisoli TaxID=1578198 RepID=A0A417YPR5_9BACI|nr:hypothetical protein [Neobacillus notoginsengisoli]RHW35994.1 hypothetical protein D1B31_18065 [Neobacillus notoginsengisoli]
MKKYIFLSLLLCFTLVMTGCSSKGKTASGKLKVTEENKSYLDIYEKSLQGYVLEMNAILKTFNNSVDGLYTQQYSREQFKTAIKGTIEKSNALVTEIESVDVKPELFEANQSLIAMVNRSHQLLLNAIDMANKEDTDIDKDYLRSEYMDIKIQQAEIANQWKILREELEIAEQGANQ